MQAAAEMHTRIVSLLLTAGADQQRRDANGMTALLLAANSYYAQEDMLSMMLAKRANPEDTDGAGNTALMLAARQGAFQAIKPLVDGGVDVNARNKQGLTALQIVKESKEDWTRQEWGEQRRAEVIKRLINAGAK